MRLLVWVAVLAGCSGDEGSGGNLSTRLEGIYTLIEWTQNETGCDAEGPSVLATQTDKFLIIRGNNVFGERFIELFPCPTLDECRIDAADDSIFLTEHGSVNEGSDSAGWTGGRIAIRDYGGTCGGTVTTTTLTAEGAMAIRMDVEIHPTGAFPPGAKGICNFDDAEAAAATQPCDGFDVLRGAFTESLP